MANTLANIARVVSATTGTGTLTLGAAVTGFNTFADAGITDGQTVTYAIEDYTAGVVSAREVGEGVYSSAGPTLTRATVYSSTSAGAKINCSGTQQVFITVAKEDFDSFTTDLTAHLNDTSDAHDASAISFTPAGNVAATDVQAAIAELDTEKLSTSAAASTYQPLDADLTAIAALATAAYGRSLLETTSEANFKATVNLEIGTDVQAYDAELAAIAGLTSAADRLPYFTGSGTAALATFTTAGRNLLDDADNTAQRTTLGLGTAAVANTGTSGNTVPFLDGANTWSGVQTLSTASAAAALVLTSSASFAIPITIESTNGDALAGPYMNFQRISASPANSDLIGGFNFRANNSTPSGVNYCTIQATAFTVTAGAETGRLQFNTLNAGTNGTVLSVRVGAFVGSPTGFDTGAGTLNAVTLYQNGSTLASLYGALASANTFTAAQTISVDSAATNTVTAVATLRSTSTGTPAAGIGVALNFAAETAAGNNEIGAQIAAVTTDVTSTSEDFDLVFSAMAAGAAVAERGRVTSKGTYKYPSFTVAGLPAGTAGETAFASDGRKNGEGAAAGTGVLVFHDGTAWRACDTGATVAA